MSDAEGKAWAIVVAAGEGKRLRVGRLASGPRKPFIQVAGKPVLQWTLETVARSSVEQTVVVVGADDVKAAEAIVSSDRERLKVAAVVAGGVRRQDSVALGLRAVPENVEIVAVHDGTRPLARPELFGRVVEAAKRTGAAVACLPVSETVKRAETPEATLLARETIDRSGLWAAQTPQAFRRAELARLLDEAEREGVEVTDDAQAFDRKGLAVEIVRGDPANLKITTPEDLGIAESILEKRLGPAPRPADDVRVGSGFDIHPLVEGRRLVVCGLALDSPVGGQGHSDADAAAHAVTDALLGAAALGDIGGLFPDTDPAYKDAESVKLLADAAARVREAGFEPRSFDVTIFLEKPRLAPHVDEMRRRVAEAVGIAVGRVSVKAKTMNGMGPVGEGRAYAAQATAVVAARSRAAPDRETEK